MKHKSHLYVKTCCVSKTEDEGNGAAPAAEHTMKTEKAEVAESSWGDPLFASSIAPAATPASAIAPAAAACTCMHTTSCNSPYLSTHQGHRILYLLPFATCGHQQWHEYTGKMHACSCHSSDQAPIKQTKPCDSGHFPHRDIMFMPMSTMQSRTTVNAPYLAP